VKKNRSRINIARRGNTRKNKRNGRKENIIHLISLCCPQNYNFACGSVWV
jgi:hypothetical protein